MEWHASLILLYCNNFEIWILNFEISKRLLSAWGVFPIHPAGSIDRGFFNAGIGGGKSFSAQNHFFGGYCIGKTKNRSDVVCIQYIIENYDYWIFFD